MHPGASFWVSGYPPQQGFGAPPQPFPPSAQYVGNAYAPPGQTYPGACPGLPPQMTARAAHNFSHGSGYPGMPGPPSAVPNAFPNVVPNAVPNAMPGLVPNAVPNAVPHAVPNAMFGSMPGSAMPNVAPGAPPGAPPAPAQPPPPIPPPSAQASFPAPPAPPVPPPPASPRSAPAPAAKDCAEGAKVGGSDWSATLVQHFLHLQV